MTETVLIYATKRQRKQLTRQGIEILTEYEDYVLAQATQAEVAALQANGYEVEIYEASAGPVPGVGFGVRERVSAGTATGRIRPRPASYVVEFGGPIKPEWLATDRRRTAVRAGTDAARQLRRRLG